MQRRCRCFDDGVHDITLLRLTAILLSKMAIHTNTIPSLIQYSMIWVLMQRGVSKTALVKQDALQLASSWHRMTMISWQVLIIPELLGQHHKLDLGTSQLSVGNPKSIVAFSILTPKCHLPTPGQKFGQSSLGLCLP